MKQATGGCLWRCRITTCVHLKEPHLAHYVRTGDLSRALLAAAKNENDIAFAWGWVSHIVANVIVHPLVNDAVGRWADHGGPSNYAEDPVAHLRFEMGVDGHYQHRLDIEETSVLYFDPQNPSNSSARLGLAWVTFNAKTRSSWLSEIAGGVRNSRRVDNWDAI